MKRPGGLAHRFFQHAGRLFIPSLVLAELHAGANLRDDPAPILKKIGALLEDVEVIDFDAGSAVEYGRVYAEIRRRGVTVPPIDLLIASVALAHDLTLVTNNTADFASIPGLRLEDWLDP
jgi:tRNA(fMet)-specific endonuclease VapC